ncbi:MAG: InlB B-repeat-containing protein [Bacilli bacterium]|nr:InlB B-repeat-containing protein [Bacilli bacterium]
MKSKKGFTLVELIATIAILSIIVLISAPSVIKSFNKSRIQAMAIQENKLIETGEVLLDDFCRDAIDDSYKEQCEVYYQELVLSNEEKENNKDILNKNKIYKYICVDDMKKLNYYTEDLKFSGTPCQGVVVYEIDYYTNRQTDAYSYIKCEDAYKTQNRNEKLENLFQNCFDEYRSDENYNKTYTVTIKHVENDLGGMEIKPRETKVLKGEDYNKDIIFSIKTIPHERNGNTYYSALNKGGKDIEYDDTRKENGLKIYDIKKLPQENLTISIVYSVQKHNVITNYYRYSPGGLAKNHNNEKMNSKEQTTLTGFTYETVTVDAPKTITDKVDGKDELFNLAYAYIDDEQMSLPFNKNVDIGRVDKNVELVYQRDAFNITYDNKGGSGCEKGRTKFNKEYGTLCEPTRKGYTFKGWSLTDGGQKLASTDINENYHDLTLYALWEANKYTITYHIGNASSTVGTKVVKTKTCTFDQICTLDTFSTLGIVFPYSKEDESANGAKNYGWSFHAWSTSKDIKPNSSNIFDTKYTDGQSFKYLIDGNINLYAIGKRNLHINGGVAPTKSYSEPIQYWNPYGTSDTYLTQVSLPNAQNISGWTFIGFRCGDDTADSNVTLAANLAGTKYKVPYNKYPYTRSVYQRTLTVKYNANGGSGTTASHTGTQYYNSGYGSGGANKGANVSQTNFTLKANAFTYAGYDFTKWAAGSKTGTKYSAGSTYSMKPAVTSTSITTTMYAIWDSKTYTITYYIGNASSTAGATAVGSSTCDYKESCTLKAFTSLSKVFPYSSQDTGKNNYGWSFYGWTTSTSSLTRNYANSATFTYNTVGNIKLYAIGSRNINFNSGESPKSPTKVTQYWNPYGTSGTYLSEVTIPSPTSISGWTFIGYKGGSNEANSSVTLSSSLVGKSHEVPYNAWPQTRGVYKRTLTVSYNANGGTGTTSSQTGTQYYNTGYGNGTSNTGATLSSTSFTLASNAFTKSGYAFSKWAESSASGTKYSAGSTYTMNPTLKSTATTKTMYATWTDNTAPTTPTYAAKFTSGNTAYTSGSWTNKEVYTTITSTDAGSGVAKIQYSNDKSSWSTLTLAKSGGITKSGTTFTGSEVWSVTNGRNETIYFRACDASNNCSSASSAYTIKYDTAAPTCSVGKSGTLSADKTYYVSSVTLSLTKNDTGGSGLKSYGLANSSTVNYNSKTSGTQGNSASGVTWYGFVADNAGNTATCNSGKVVVKSTPPRIEFSLSGSTSTATCYDGETGTKIGTNTKSVGNSTHTYTCTDSSGLSTTCSQDYKSETHTSTGEYSCACTGCCGTCTSGWCYCCCNYCGTSSYTVVSKSGDSYCN